MVSSRVTGGKSLNSSLSSLTAIVHPSLRFQKQVGQVRIHFSPGGNKRIAGIRVGGAKAQTRPLFRRGIVSSIFPRRSQEKQMNLPDARQLEEQFQVSRRQTGGSEDRDPLWQSKRWRLF